MPKIYCFSNIQNGGEGLAIAIAEDGTVLGSHFCSSEIFVPNDLGVTKGTRPDRHERYKAHYPGGYEMEFVRAKDVSKHPKLQAALKLNKPRIRS